jgi:hypothetical protein
MLELALVRPRVGTSTAIPLPQALEARPCTMAPALSSMRIYSDCSYPPRTTRSGFPSLAPARTHSSKSLFSARPPVVTRRHEVSPLKRCLKAFAAGYLPPGKGRTPITQRFRRRRPARMTRPRPSPVCARPFPSEG